MAFRVISVIIEQLNKAAIMRAGVVQTYFPHKFISESHADWLRRSARKLKNTHTNLTTTPINFIPILIKSEYSFTVNFNK